MMASTSTTALKDDALPGLHIALEAPALVDLLSQHLPECSNGTRLLDARVDDVQYTPGAAAQVLMKLRVRDAHSGRTGRQLVCVKALRGDEPAPVAPEAGLQRYAELRARKAGDRDMPLATGWAYLPGAHLVLQAYPLDSRLSTLASVIDPVAMRDALHQVWRARQVRVRSVRGQVLSYTPEARAALLFDVLSEDRVTRVPEMRRLVGKLHVSREPARLFAGHWAVWRGAGGHGVAPPVGYVSQMQLSLQEFVPGTRLSDLAGTGAFTGLVRRAAHVIANIHGMVLPVLATRRVEKEVAVIDRWIGVLARLRPAYAGRLESLARRLRSEVAERMRVTGTIHADFHMANILCDGQRVTIIDWDQAAHGDPMIDVGRVLASLRVSSLRVHNRLDGFADAEAGFLEAYLRRTGEDERRARLFEAVSLLIAAAGPFRLQRAGWEEGAELMMDEVERVLDLSLKAPRVAGTPADLKRQVAFRHRAAWAMDRTYAQALLVPQVQASVGRDVEVTECYPVAEAQRPDELRVRWLLKGYRGAERWRGQFTGLGFPDHSGRGLLRRLQLLGPVLDAQPAALQLPRAVGHLEPLSMLVLRPPAGEPLTAALAGGRGAAAAATLGRALALFSRLPVELGKAHETGRALRGIERRVQRRSHLGAAAAAEAAELFAAAQARVLPLGERRLPVAVGLVPAACRVGEGSAGAGTVVDVLMGEPLVALAELHAALRETADLRDGVLAADVLVRAYADTSGDDMTAVAGWLALVLVRRACGRSRSSDPAATLGSARQLLERFP
jgi:Ser/Thr protein kinase RdoA (MazF antagonist)